MYWPFVSAFGITTKHVGDLFMNNNDFIFMDKTNTC